ncbi:MAG: phage holin family protein [Solirubrobacteraceae bacterium]|nr:phage holin family protein [Solirubrobacteraceae bacterium]
MALSEYPAPSDGRPEQRDESIGALLKQLSEQTTTLVKQELELARAELTEHGKRAGVGAGLVGGGGVVALYAGGALTAALIAALATGMATWLAALIVGGVYAAVAGVLAIVGKNKVVEATPPAPQTAETIKEDVSWAKTQKTSASR